MHNMNKEKLLKRIEVNPEIVGGKPVISGTRVPIDLIMRLYAQGVSTEEILEDYPHLEKEDIQAVLLYAAEVLSDEEVFPLRLKDESAKNKVKIITFIIREHLDQLVGNFLIVTEKQIRKRSIVK